MRELTKKQKEIYDVAIEMFHKKGYIETSLRDIAAQLNITVATIYSHFSSKDEILEVICDKVYLTKQNNLKKFKNNDSTIEEKFKNFIKNHIIGIISNEKAFHIYNKYWNIANHRVQGKYEEVNKDYFNATNNIVKNFFPDRIELACYRPNAIIHFVLDLIANVVRLRRNNEVDIDLMTENIYQRILYGYQNEM